MPAFEYKALDAKGKQLKGVIEADTARHARSQLREQRMMPLEILPVTEKEAKAKSSGFSVFKRGISVAELALITRHILYKGYDLKHQNGECGQSLLAVHYVKWLVASINKPVIF